MLACARPEVFLVPLLKELASVAPRDGDRDRVRLIDDWVLLIDVAEVIVDLAIRCTLLFAFIHPPPALLT